MITLAISSSTSLVGVALARNGDVVAQRSLLTDRRHAEEITPMLANVMASASLELDAIDRIVVDVGPGRFTGMRVGIATAKALAFAIDIPIVPVSSLQLIGGGFETQERPVFAVVDARRNQVFAARAGHYDDAWVLSPSELTELVPSDALLVGDGADRYAEEFATFATVQPGVHPDVGAAALLDPGLPGLPASQIEPLYLREPDAAINIKTRPGAAGVKA